MRTADRGSRVEDHFPFAVSHISAEGRYRLTDVPPGTYRISVFAPAYAVEGEKNPLTPGRTVSVVTGVNSPKGLALARVEQNGVEVNEFNVNPGDQITGVRLVFSYGAGVIAGRIEVKGGSLPAGARLSVGYRPEGGRVRGQPSKSVEVDGRGQFVIEGLSQGTYKLFLGRPLWRAQRRIRGHCRARFLLRRQRVRFLASTRGGERAGRRRG